MNSLPYCGLPPTPAELLARFNADPLLIAALTVLAIGHLSFAVDARSRRFAATGWLISAAALLSPLCALSVSLFSARVAQHMVLVLLAAPLIAVSTPRTRQRRGVWALYASAGTFILALWFWHMPVPYDATFSSTLIYWSMHTTLFGSAIWLWRELLLHRAERTAEVLMVGALTSMQMGLLGAVLTFASHPMFLWHLTTTAVWGFTPLRDQQLGGILMWVPGIALFLCAAIRSLGRLWGEIEEARSA